VNNGTAVPVPGEVFLAPDEAALLLSPFGTRRTFYPLPADAFAAAWGAAGRWLAVALRDWAELPVTGRLFFAGSRDRDGTYHWDTAECDTDTRGRILRL
jgi:hypothetical protein